MAPSRYSNVRKVTFSCALQWFENDPSRSVSVRLLVGPMSTSATSRVIHAKSFPLASLVLNTGSPQDTPWQFEPDQFTNATFQNTMLYSRRGGVDTLVGNLAAGENDTHHFSITFDRFSGLDDDFFADWDAVSDLGDDDVYVGYDIYPSFVESTFIAGATSNLENLAMACHVTQAPGPVNNTCTWVGVGRFNSATYELNAFRRTAFSVWPDEHRARWKFRASEWDGITQAAVWNQIGAGIISSNQFVRYRIDQANDAADALNVIDQQDFDGLTGGVFMDVVRSADISSLLVDGDVYGGDYLVEGIGGNFTTAPTQTLEITQKSTTKTIFIVDLGSNGVGPNKISANGPGYLEPLFFEDFPDSFFTARRFEGVVLHTLMANLMQYEARHDSQLDSKDDDPSLSATALTVGDGQINTSGLDDALNPQSSFQSYGIANNDPLRLFGNKKLYTKVTPAEVGDSSVGRGFLAYSHSVPDTDVLELGPLFQLGEFNPEGCAATSAGLGDPGVLVITNGSTIPQKFNPQAQVVEDNGVPTPFKGEVPSSAVDDTTASPDNGLKLGAYLYRYTFRNCCTGKEGDPNPEDIPVDTSTASPAAAVTLSFAGVRIPADPQICEICIYRTVLGGDFPVMAKVGCFNPDDTTVFIDDISDAALDFFNDGLSILNAPMPCVPVVIEFQNRLFGLGDIPDLSPAGTVDVINGSIVVTGNDDVEWTRCLAGKYLQVEGDCRSYEIDSVQPPAVGLSPPLGRLCLVEEYEGVTDQDLNYTICGHPNRLYVSEPFEPECWPIVLFLDVEPGDGDRLMGGISNFSRLVVCKRNKTYVLTFRDNPVLEVSALSRISSDIGCVGPRTFAQVEMGSVWLSDRGLVLFDGRGVSHIPESDRMNQLYVDPDNDRYMRRDSNGRVIGAVGAFYPKREQYLCLIPTKQTTRGANLMVVWDVKLRNVTLYEFCQEFLSMVVAKDAEGNERLYLGDTNGFVWILDIGENDGVGFPNATGTIRGTVTSAGIDAVGASFIEDSTASFLTGGLPAIAGLSGTAGLSGAFEGTQMGLAGVCVHYRATNADKDDPWRVRTVYASTSTRLYVTPNWAGDVPDDTTYEYMLGAIDFRAIFKPKDYGTQDIQKRNWSHILTYVPEEVATQMRVELLTDLESTDQFEDTIQDGDPLMGGAGRVFDLSFAKGRQTQPIGIDVHSFLQVKLTNFAPEEPAKILNHTLRMTGRPQS